MVQFGSALRAGWVKPVSDHRLFTLVSIGVLTKVFPLDLVDEVIAGAGRTEQRNRTLPARVMALRHLDDPLLGGLLRGRPRPVDRWAVVIARVARGVVATIEVGVPPSPGGGDRRVCECGTHGIFDAVVGFSLTSEFELSKQLVETLQPGFLALANRCLYGFALWELASRSGADLLWPVKSNLKPRHVETLDDGSWLAEIKSSGNAGRKATPVTDRVIDYVVDDG